jgi:hypothetical protein
MFMIQTLFASDENLPERPIFVHTINEKMR